jgi:hypothetical protein
MYSTRHAGLLRKIYQRVTFKSGALPLMPNTEKLFCTASPMKKTTTLKISNRTKMLKISGDLEKLLSFCPPKVLLFLNRDKKAWINPVTQKKVATLAIKTEISNNPICSLDNPILVKTMDIIRKVTNRRMLKTCNPAILLTFFLGANHTP